MTVQLEWLEPGLLHVLWPAEHTEEELEEDILLHDQAVTEWNGPYASVQESVAPPKSSPAQRRRLSQWTLESRTTTHRDCCGLAFVYRSPIARGMITMVFWFIDTPYPVKTFGSRQEALAWCRSLFEVRATG